MNTEIISVNIQKGGCAKSSTVQILGEILGKLYNKKVLCIDTDPQCNLTTISGIELEDCAEHNLYTLLNGNSTLEECIVKATYYDVIPGSVWLSNADIAFNKIGKEQMLKEAIEGAKYDYILIDTPPALGLLNIMSLTASTKLLIPTECSYLSMVGLEQLFQTIESVKKYTNPNLELLGILMVKYSARTNLNAAIYDALNEMAAEANTKVFEAKIRETVKVREAQSQMQPLIEWAPSCSAMEDYKALVKEIFPTLK